MIENILIICIIFLSYSLIEVLIKNFYSSFLGKDDIWKGYGVYIWGLIILTCSIITFQTNFIFNLPKNSFSLIKQCLYILCIITFIVYFDISLYDPNKSNIEIFNYCVFVPLLEEIAFRGIILPSSIVILNSILRTNSIFIITGINSIIFVLFHLNYISFNRKTIFSYVCFLFWGIAFSYISYLSKSIIYSTLLHIILNTSITMKSRIKANTIKKFT